ncbi:MAG: hypothetical protein GY774_27350 [Planctomycetes bacterium]|nr:hypothetical protein [Planctomycetota bacterium]
MKVSKKQLEANKKNAPKGGVKTQEGKAIVKYNALKHGLLAKETVITVGEGAESPEEFNSLLEDMRTQLNPMGTLEEMLVEKIVVAYWRLRRAYRYEVGLIRKELDTATDDFYSEEDWQHKKVNKTDEEIDQEIEENKGIIESWNQDKKDFTKMRKQGKPLEDIYDWEGNWEWLEDKFQYLVHEHEDYDGFDPQNLREFLNNKADWSDDQIWEAHIELCNEQIDKHKKKVADLGKQKQQNKLKLQVIKKLGNIPSKCELDRLLRYEGAIERQLYKALNQLERIQRLRAGDNVPAPVEIDVAVNTDQNT